MPWRTAPAWPDRPPPATVQITSYWPARAAAMSGCCDHHAQHRTGEIDLDLARVDRDLAGARLDPDAGDRVLALAGGVGAAELVDLLLVLGRIGRRRGLELRELVERLNGFRP